MDFSFTERGNNAFRNDEGAAVIFSQQGKNGEYIQAAFTPMNYPAWEVGTLFLYGEELFDHIHDNLGGWYADKSQAEVNLDPSGCVVDTVIIVEEVVDLVVKQASDGDYDPTQTDGARVSDAIIHCATTLGYHLTVNMFESCYTEAMESF